MTALFRLVEINQGTIEVDGLDISKLGLNALRQGLSIIPQEALLVSGTVRSTLLFFLSILSFPPSARYIHLIFLLS
jgi:ABC-type multidrug transport system fused ATPase/permease subunit